MSIESIMGVAACSACIAIALVGLPIQVYKNYKRKSVKGLSLVFWVLCYVNGWLWVGYGYSKSIIDWYMIAANIPGIFIVSFLFFQFYIYSGDRGDKDEAES